MWAIYTQHAQRGSRPIHVDVADEHEHSLFLLGDWCVRVCVCVCVCVCVINWRPPLIVPTHAPACTCYLPT